MKNWKTTLGGVLVATGTAMQAFEDQQIKLIGIAVGAIGALILGAQATDAI